MKLLSLCLNDHDMNMSYFDGETLHYYKSERDFGIKHHWTEDIFSWRDIIKNVWGLDYRELDDVALCIFPKEYDLPINNQEYPYGEYDLIPVKCNVTRLEHYYAHSLSAEMFVEKADIHFIIDGCDDEMKNCWSIIKDGRILEQGTLVDNGSVGLHLRDAGRFLGLKGNCQDIAGKLMSLQSYGQIDYEFLKKIEQFNIYQINDLYNFDLWIKHIGDERLAMLQPLNWITTLHHKTGLIILDLFKRYSDKDDHICYTGGVAQNIIWNTQLKKHFKNLYIPPHSGDEGLSLGGIEFLRRKHNLPKFDLSRYPFMQSDVAVEEPSGETIKKTAQLLADGKIVAWYQGHGEVGPRALGNRSILMDARIPNGKELINSIKRRENFRPFGASVLKEHKEKHFDMEFDNPYMLYYCEVKDKNLQSITHIDNTCRVQTVDNENPIFRKLLEEYYKITGSPVLLNTSLNLNKKPIAGRPEEALELLNTTNIDCAVIGDKIYE